MTLFLPIFVRKKIMWYIDSAFRSIIDHCFKKKKALFLEFSIIIRTFVTIIHMTKSINIMKKTIMTLFAAMTLMLSSCMTAGMGTTSNTGSSSDILNGARVGFELTK